MSSVTLLLFKLNFISVCYKSSRQIHRGTPGRIVITLTFSSTIQIKSILLAYEAVKTTINDRVGWRGYVGRVIWV